jgi:PKD domain
MRRDSLLPEPAREDEIAHMRSTLRLAIPVVLAFAVLPGAASAQTFCVYAPPGCSGTTSTNLAEAFLGAAGNGIGTRDTIRIGAGTFDDGPVGAIADSPVDVVGEGATKTILRAKGTSVTVLKVSEPSSTVSDLGIEITGTGNEVGLELAGAAQRIRVTSSGTQASSIGVLVSGQGAVVDESLVSLDYTPGELSHAVFAVGGASGTVTDSRLVGMTGAEAAEGSLDVQRTRIWADRGAEAVHGGYLSISDSLVRSPGPHPTGYQPYALGAGGTGQSLLEASRVTAYSDDSQYSTGVDVDPNDVQGASAAVSVYDSVLWKFARTAWLIESQGHSTFWSQWNAFDKSKYVHVDPGALYADSDNLDLDGVDPGFVDAAGGDFALRPGSPLIDAANPGYQPVGTLDLARNPRLREGDGAGGPAVDLGAYEFQNTAPVVSASATPATAQPGAPIALTATATDLDVGDSLSYAWSFDDGGTATGPDATHAFATAGDHSATVTVTDATGRTGSATASVSISAPQTDSGTPPVPAAPPASPPAKRGAPRISRLRLSPHVFRARGTRVRPAVRRHPAGTVVHFKLSERATVTLTVLERRKGRWVKRGSVKRAARAGSVSVRFAGRLRRHALAAGRYRLRVQARAGGRSSNAVLARFRIAA